MKRYLFWRICFLITHRLEYHDHGSPTYANGTYWPSTPRMMVIWKTNQMPGRRVEFPIRLYRRLRKHRHDIQISTILNNGGQGHVGNTLVSGAWEAAGLLEQGFKIRTYQQGDRTYIVGVRGEIAGLWR